MCRILLNLFPGVCAGLPWGVATCHLWRESLAASGEELRRLPPRLALYAHVRVPPNAFSPRLRRADFHESIEKLGDLNYLCGESK